MRTIRSMIISGYAAFVSFIGWLMSGVKPRENQVTLLVSFQENAAALIDTYQQQANMTMKLTVLYTKHASAIEKDTSHLSFRYFHEKNPLHLIQCIYTMFKSKVVVTDNYFLMTSVLRKRPSTTCIQVWHANGALKKFGLEDASNSERSPRDIKRFKRVYASFDYIVTGSDHMREIFKSSFGVNDERFLPTGVPMTDLYYDQRRHSLKPNDFPKGKKILLYAPTYRDFAMDGLVLPFSKELLQTELNGDYILLVKLHPTVKHLANAETDGEWIFDVSDQPLYPLLRVCDVLITDYSSIVFEYALLEKPVLFFTYDLDTYREKRGLVDRYEDIIPGKACVTQNMLLKELLHLKESDHQRQIKTFAEEWNQYSEGRSSEQLLSFIEQQLLHKKRPASQ
ncbi:CDP-glycerol--glycerophosphate glycerophosphotransferase [Bacillus pumilus]|uniref:CDP-glycerol--glycerophosphate glycerophosphotransferase n=1 Tax=Bacillus pumilus (strain SAFR-032) TaxID=315750 RepID=A8FI18_BACP2|nr:CDP-glycerol--glycerophosphate glycerophosphotransferase [Bacillus pumilus]ABV63885.1 CDP-glycerol--glycerophosphate glycerophosphotransferase [Bacillus pumilus SAFR-032]MBC3641353.1 CDP-glycerol--glycerophosphate glycerophosphotransferase [Bacillus pumilus]MBC3646981.1 CDP-glycerol--glycerophosphate glycerophosphotransferase [Bacillus pumilus]MBC3648325.1 CDP-glycerol--glycerophosphate glycerophosphotransferase [Bacillus pumilus]MBC3652285.1 CDP-glycerol--glycerophosphate glycerophosphotra